jgi:hypothetical protein
LSLVAAVAVAVSAAVVALADTEPQLDLLYLPHLL